MEKEQFETLKQFEDIFIYVAGGGRPRSLSREEIAIINPIAKSVVNETYSKCASCINSRLRLFKRLGSVYLQYKESLCLDS